MVVFDDHVSRYAEELDKKYDVCEVPLKLATNETLRDFGRLVTDFEKEEVSDVTHFLVHDYYSDWLIRECR